MQIETVQNYKSLDYVTSWPGPSDEDDGIEIIQKNFRDLSLMERRCLSPLSVETGAFGYSLRKFLRPQDQNNVVLICQLKTSQRFIAWGMYYPGNVVTGYDNGIYNLWGVNWGIYVDPEFRRLGLASLLTSQAIKAFGEIKVHASDSINRSFFQKQKTNFNERIFIK